jgi:hypothetical protein
VGSKTGEPVVGVVVLLDVGVSVNASVGLVAVLGRPRRDRKDRLANDSAFDGCCDSPDACAASFASFGAPGSARDCSCSLNCAASGCDWDGVLYTATSPTCFCGSPLAGALFTSGFPLYQNAQPAGFEVVLVVVEAVSVVLLQSLVSLSLVSLVGLLW